MSTPAKKRGSKKRGSKRPKSLSTKDRLIGILPQTLRSSNRRLNGSGTPARKVGSLSGGKGGGDTENGVPVPQALSGRATGSSARVAARGSKARMSNARAVRMRAGSTTSVASEKGKNEVILHSGYLKKKGVVNVAWKNRYFVLTNKFIYYYEKDPEVGNILEVTAKGKIPLVEITGIEKDLLNPKEKKDKSKPSKKDPTHFHINTATRIYRLQSYNDNNDQKAAQRDADGWIGSIAGAIENCRQMLYKPRRKESSSSLEWIKEHEKNVEDGINISFTGSGGSGGTVSALGPNEPARLANWLNWSPFDVAAWLYKVDLSKVYSELFYENKVDGEKLAEMTKGDLSNIGVDSEDDRMKILTAVEELRSVM